MRIRPEIKVTIVYLLFGTLWVLLSDKMLNMLPPAAQQLLQTIKGVLFVGITAFLLYILLRKYYKELNRRIEHLERHELALEQQNKKLRDISWMQSHVVRSPLATLMGCLALLKEVHNSPEDMKQILDGLDESATKLDDVIRQISKQSEIAGPETGSQLP